MNRRGFLTGAIGFLAAPAIVRASSLMPVKAPSLLDLQIGGRTLMHVTADGTSLWRDAANTLALRNGWPLTEVYRVYSTDAEAAFAS